VPHVVMSKYLLGGQNPIPAVQACKKHRPNPSESRTLRARRGMPTMKPDVEYASASTLEEGGLPKMRRARTLLCSRTMIVIQQPAQPRTTDDRSVAPSYRGGKSSRLRMP
jgi:hypothetical protein